MGVLKVPRRIQVELEGGLYHVYDRNGHEECPSTDEHEAAAFVALVRALKKRDELVQLCTWH